MSEGSQVEARCRWCEAGPEHTSVSDLSTSVGGGRFQVYCRLCLSYGPAKETEAKAVRAWNSPPTPPAPPASASVEEYLERVREVVSDHYAQDERERRTRYRRYVDNLRAIPLPEQPSLDVEAWRSKALKVVESMRRRPAEASLWLNDLEALIEDAAALPARREGPRFSDRPVFTPRQLEAAKVNARTEGERRGIERAVAWVRENIMDFGNPSVADSIERHLLPRPEGDAPEKEGG